MCPLCFLLARPLSLTLSPFVQVCAGLSKRILQTAKPGALPRVPTSSESLPGGGDFRYVCVGYSAYDTKHLKEASKNRRRHDQPVEVPYCEGMEIISAAAVSSNRELLPHAADITPKIPGNRQLPKEQRDASLEKHAQDSRRIVPLGNPLRNSDWDGFQERFERMAKRIGEKMQSNATYMARSFVRSWEQIFSDRSSGSSNSNSGI